ncbi:MAG: ABC transporter ATP-binding protein [archaeon]|nr:ABC transporter ATP-binding protein [Nanoarchaeota archaeon]
MNNSQKLEQFKIEHLSKVYGRRFIFNDISFDVKTGEIFGIIGKSGSGKTTLLNLLVGIIKADKGQVLFRDVHLINTHDDKALRPVKRNNKDLRRIYGFAAQRPSLYPNLTAWENLMYFGSLYNINTESLTSNAENLLRLMDLTQAKNVKAKKMSGGMQRRLDIACSLIHDPKILILDEPTADLDPVLSEKIWHILKVINQRGTTIVLASHHVIQLEQLCDRVAIIKEGKIAAIGFPKEIKASNAIEETIFVRTIPGNYDKIISQLKKTHIKNDVQKYKIKNKELIIDAIKSSGVVNELMKILPELGEEVVDIEFKKPTLDKIFIKIEREDSDKHKVADHRAKIQKIKAKKKAKAAKKKAKKEPSISEPVIKKSKIPKVKKIKSEKVKTKTKIVSTKPVKEEKTSKEKNNIKSVPKQKKIESKKIEQNAIVPEKNYDDSTDNNNSTEESQQEK